VFIADFKTKWKIPHGRRFIRIGVNPSGIEYFIKKRTPTCDCLTVTGKTLAENLANVPEFRARTSVIRPFRESYEKLQDI